MTTNQTESSERRRYRRTQLQMPLQAICLDPDGDMVVYFQMLDISRGGIGASSTASFYPGQRLVLKVPAPGMSVRNLCATVRRCRKADDGSYQLGFEFDHPVVSLATEAPEVVSAAA